MIIGIDASSLTLPHPTGVQRYIEQIIKHLLELNSDHAFRLYSPTALSEPFTAHQTIITSPRFWTQIRLPIELLLHKPDVFFQPGYMLPPYCPCPSVATVHDLAWVKYPDSYSTTQLASQKTSINRLMRKQAEVIVPSVSAQQDLLDAFELDPRRVHVIPEALIPLPEAHVTDFPEVLRYKRHTVVLTVGRLESRKNTVTLVKAMQILQSKMKKESKPLVLVLVGQAGYGAESIFAAIKQARSMGVEIVHRADADDRELAAWFSIASVLAYPSLYEGFGLPILQAFAAQVPVVTSRVSSIPEVAGDAAQYIEYPKDEDELAAALNSVLYTDDKAKKLIDLGTKQLQKFSWDSAAKETLSVIE